MSAGDTCYVLDGTYTLTSSFIITVNGTSEAARVRFVSLNRRGAKIINSIAITDSAADAAIQIHSDYVDVEGFDISGIGAIGIYSSGSATGSGSPLGSYNRIRYNYIHDLGLTLDDTHNVTAIDMARYGSGVYCANYNEVSFNTILNISAAHNSGCNGIYFGTAYGTVYNNIVSGLPGFGIKSYHFSNHMLIANNLVFNCGDDSLDPAGGQGGGILIEAGGTGWTAGVDEPNDFSVVINNIIKDCHGWAGLYENADNGGSPSTTHVANNTFSNNCVSGSTGIYGDVRLDSGAPHQNPVINVPTSTLRASDTFMRANQSGFGTATDTQVWANAGDTTHVQLSILSNQGKVTNSTAANYITLGGTNYSGDGEVKVRISTSSTSISNQQGALLRYTDTTHWYAAYLRGTQIRIDSAAASLANVAFSEVANTEYWMRFNITGTRLSVRVWADGTTEPTTWNLTAVDSTLTTGKPGIYANPDASGTTAVYDSFTFVTLVTDTTFPNFVNYQIDGSGDYHLLHTSACIDAGTSTGAPSTDLDGVARPQINGFDVGPYELVLAGALVDIAGQSVFVEATTLSFERTVGRRSQASCTILTTTATHFQQDQQVAIYDKKNTLVFSGYITSPKEHKPGFQPALEHDISCVDQHRIADKRVVAATYTNKTPGYIVNDIYTNILVQEGVTIGLIYDGAALADLFPNTTVFPSTTLYPTESVGVIPSAIFAYCTVAQAFDELVKSASASGVPYYWMIDERKRLWFVPYTAIVNSTVIDGTQIDDGTLSGMVPSVIRANPTYRNTQYLLGGVAQTVTQNETRKGDGNTTSWPMNFDLASAPTITVNTVAKAVGIRGLDTGKDWYWQKGSPDISQDSSGTKLVSTDTLAVTYIGQYPTVIIDQNNAQISYEQSLDNTTGIVEEVESDATITSVANGLATTSQLLTRYAQQGLILEFMTLNSSYGPGQLVTVNLPDYGINNEQMLIEEVTASDQIDGFNIWYDVKAIQGPYDMNWVAFFSKTLAQQTMANSINVGIGQSVVIAASGSVTFTPSVTGSATVNACPVPSTSTFPGLALFPC